MKTIGRYQIIRELGRGGMATVYLAQDPNFGREVAVKVLPHHLLDGDATMRARFDREARTIASLEHSAIVPVYDFGEANGQPFLVMRYMRGGSVADKLANGPVPVRESAEIIRRIASALDAAHSKGFVHRDLKPGNILLDEQNQAFLSDFGIAKLVHEGPKFTATGGVIGTPTYMSPEQVRGSTLDGRSDIYTLGIILFELLTGKVPYDADTPIAVAFKHVNDPIPDVRELNPQLHGDFVPIIEKALAKQADDRYQTANAMAQDLLSLTQAAPSTQLLNEPLATPHPPTAPAQKEPKKGVLDGVPTMAKALLGTLGLALAAALTWFLLNGFGLADEVPTPTPELVVSRPTLEPIAPPDLIRPILLAGAANAPLTDFADPPFGEVLLGGVPFFIGNDIIKTQAGSGVDQNFGTEVRISTSIARANKLFLLVNSGNGFARFNGQEIGVISVNCQNGNEIVGRLQLGNNLREWQTSENVVTAASGVSEVFTESIQRAPGVTAHIDMVEFDLPTSCQQRGLSLIVIRDISQESVGEADPALNIFGMAVQSADTENDFINVSARDNAGATGIFFEAGENFAIEVISGQWSAGPLETFPYVGAAGDSQVPNKNTFPFPDGPVMALVGRIGTGDSFLINDSEIIVAPNDGELFLLPNDDDLLDNSGSLDVDVRNILPEIALVASEEPAERVVTIATSTPDFPAVSNIRFCDRPCAESDAVTIETLPDGADQLHVGFDYSGIFPGAAYERTWRSNGEPWVIYRCEWDGDARGFEEILLFDSDVGLRSGEWEVTITVEGDIVLQAAISVEGSSTDFLPVEPLVQQSCR